MSFISPWPRPDIRPGVEDMPWRGRECSHWVTEILGREPFSRVWNESKTADIEDKPP
jgi:hypothetical protein